jgi:hypothetical protein
VDNTGAPSTKDGQGAIGRKDAWESYVSFVQQTESNSWTRFYNFLMFSSILALAWATIFSQTTRPPFASFVLTVLSGIGLASSVTWSMLGERSRNWVQWCMERCIQLETDGKVFPDQLSRVITQMKPATEGKPDALPPRIEFPRLGSYFHLRWGPRAMALLYFALFVVSILSFFAATPESRIMPPAAP